MIFEITILTSGIWDFTPLFLPCLPVNVIPTRLWDEYDEPAMPDFDVSIYMPDLKILRNVIDRMKNLSNYVVCGKFQNLDPKSVTVFDVYVIF